jgi:ASC-1-like (ASCH) protein
MTVHELKIWPEYFTGIKNGCKKHEVRKNDRDFKVGDILYLRECRDGVYTGREMNARITYISEQRWCKMGYTIFSIEVLE